MGMHIPQGMKLGITFIPSQIGHFSSMIVRTCFRLFRVVSCFRWWPVMLAHRLSMKGPISSKDLGMFSTPK